MQTNTTATKAPRLRTFRVIAWMVTEGPVARDEWTVKARTKREVEALVPELERRAPFGSFSDYCIARVN